MALQEFDADEVARLQSELHAAKPSKFLMDKVAANPKTRAQMLRLIKEVAPDLPIPELDAAKPLLDDLEQVKKEFADFKKAAEDKETAAEKKARERDVEAWQENGRKFLRKAGYQDDGVTKVEKLMQDRGLTDYEAAHALFEKSQPPEETVMPQDFGRHMLMPFEAASAAEELKAIANMSAKRGNRALDKWTQNEAYRTLAEIRGQPAARY